MELRDYIDMGAKKAGNITELGNVLGMSQPRISKARNYKEHLPLEKCTLLADYIGKDRFSVIAAAQYAMAKEDKKDFWHPFVTTAKAASIALAFSLVTNFVTPSPAEAAPVRQDAKTDFVLCKIISIKKRISSDPLPSLQVDSESGYPRL